MNPTSGDVHVNQVLTNISLAVMQSASGFVADRIFPMVPVNKQSDRYYSYDAGDFNRDEMKERAPGTETAGAGFNVKNDNVYYAPVYGLHFDIDDQTRANTDSPLKPDADASAFLAMKALIKKENLFASKFLKTGVWGTDYTGVASNPTGNQLLKWTDAASDPIKNVRDASRLILSKTGIKPNKMVLGKAAYDVLLDHPDVIDRIKAGQTPGGPAIANRVAIAALFELEQVEVMEAIVNSAMYGETASTNFINGSSALLAYAAPNPGLMTPTAGYTFAWNGLLGGSAMGGRIKQYRMENLSSDRTEIELAFDQRAVAADLAVYFDTIV